MKKNINIILLGLDFSSGNFGCSALAYSFLNLLNDIAERNNLFLNITSVNYCDFSAVTENYKVDNLRIHYKQLSFYRKYNSIVKKSDYVFDFTGGDSFSDIYGVARFCKESFLKQMALNKHKKLILGPQTIGPFNNKFVNRWAKRILKKSHKVYTRDSISRELAEKMGIDITQTTDIAFMLPEAKDYEVKISNNGKPKVAINISGLLWNGGYTGQNEFELKLNYKELCKKIIKELINKNYEVHLAAHVISKDDLPTNVCEDDYSILKEINELFPKTIIAPKFNNPMEAKKYFKYMDFFIGSRMHATIGAFSMGVPTVSIAYSRKFTGLYNSINYPYVIDGKKVETEEAFNLLIKWIENRKELAEAVEESLKKVKANNEVLKSEIEKILLEEK